MNQPASIESLPVATSVEGGSEADGGAGGRGLRDVLSRAEVRDLLQMDDRRAWLSLLTNWALVAGAFALVAWWPNPLTVVVALLVIGARQLGFAILMHEAAHRTLFRNRRWNDFAGNWLSAYPVWSDLAPYRPYHLQHHGKTWTREDPDLALATPFPITGASLKRKIWRDLSGQTGWKRARATLARDLGRSSGRVRRLDFTGSRNLFGVVATNAVLLAILALCGHAELYLLWVVAWLTTYSLVMRLRSIAEHAMILDPKDPLRNTRTTLARWWERLLLAPNYVNYHLEHHLLMTVPHYNLPRMHRLLHERGALEGACVTHGYLDVLRLAASRAG
jgi:fatty acid desaturase